MFLVEYSILNVSIARSVTLYSARRLRSVLSSTIDKKAKNEKKRRIIIKRNYFYLENLFFLRVGLGEEARWDAWAIIRNFFW